jgi:phosphohistidine phosphatase
MDLILWRHAEAEDSTPDLGRELTDKGRKQAARMADWLNPRLPQDIRILTSPATRALQTAQALGRYYDQVPALAPGTRADDVLAAAGLAPCGLPGADRRAPAHARPGGDAPADRTGGRPGS